VTHELIVRFNVPPNTLQVIAGTGFYGSKDPTNSVKALKEDTVLSIRLQSHQINTPCYNNMTYMR